MADSLQEQLVKAGLATREQADKAARPKAKKPKRNPKAQTGDAAARQGKRRRQADKSKDRQPAKRSPAKNRDSNKTPAAVEDAELIERRKIKAEIKALIEADSVKDFTGEISFNFRIGDRIRQLFVNEAAHKSIVASELAITRLNRETHLIPPAVAEKVKALNPNWLIVLNGESHGDAPNGEDPDDPYTGYDVPDDLRW